MATRLDATPAPWSHGTLEALAAALGVHRNSVTQWGREGAPAGPPYDEFSWRCWCAAKGKAAKAAPVPELLEQLVAAGIGEYVRARAAAQAAAAPPSAAGAPTAQRRLEDLLDPMASAESQQQAARYLDARSKMLELRVREGSLVPIELLDPVVDALASCCIQLFSRLPGVAAEFTSHPDEQERLRQLLVREAAAARTAIKGVASEALGRLLGASQGRGVAV